MAESGSSTRDAEILIVDDDSLNVLVLQTILKKEGYRVRVVNNGRSALQLLSTERFALILMDITMPQLDGIETTRAIRTGGQVLDPSVPIIAVSGLSGEEDRIRFAEAGMDGRLEKPFRSETVLAAVKELLGRNAGK
ncbi:response regulator [Salinispira pacifica]